jgi:hypothetical protein
MQDLRNALASTTGDASTRSVSVQLGTRYPTRVIAVNPGSPSGSLRTEGTRDPAVAFEIANAEASGETGDFWTGTDVQNYSTGALVYQPNYNLYGGAPNTYVENSIVFNKFPSGNVTLTGQTLIEGDQITLVAVDGSVSRTRAGTASVDVRPVSTSTESILVTNHTASSNVTLQLPTKLGESDWRSLLANQMGEGGNVSSVEVTNGSSFNTLTVTLERGENYTLRLAKVGVGTGVSRTKAAYMTRVTANETSVPEDGSRLVTVEVRDAFNNPVSGVTVAAEASIGDIAQAGPVTTDEDGRATFQYEADSVTTETTDVVEFSYPDHTGVFDASIPEDVALSLTILNTQVDDATVGGGNAPYIVEWQSPPDDRRLNVTAEGATIDMRALVEDGTVQNKQSVEGANVDFAVNNSTVATLSDEDALTDENGEVTTTLQAQTNGSVRVYAVSGGASDILNITFTDVPRAPSVSGVTLGNDGNGNLQLSFDADKQLGSDPADIGVSVDGPDSGTNWRDFDRGDFIETENDDGTYTYTLQTTEGYSDGSGTYTATVDDAVGIDGNNGGENGVGTDLFDRYDYAGNDPTAIQFNNFQGFTADASADEFRLDHINVQDSDDDDDLDRVEYEVTDSNGNVVATETVSDIGPAQYQAQQPAIVISGQVEPDERYFITGTVYDDDGNSDSRTRQYTVASDNTAPTFGYTQAGAQANNGGNNVEYVVFQADTSDNVGVDRVEVSVMDKGGTVIGSATFGPSFDNRQVTVTPTNMQGSGNYITVELTAYDTAGNSRTCRGRIDNLYQYIDNNGELSCDTTSS